MHIENGALLGRKNDKIMLFAATWMDLEIIMLSEVSETPTSNAITYMWNLKKRTE